MEKDRYSNWLLQKQVRAGVFLIKTLPKAVFIDCYLMKPEELLLFFAY
jgi:hypothetical protein